MPNLNLYLTEKDYARLAYLSLQTKRRVVEIVQEAVRIYLEKKVKEMEK